MTDDLSLHDTLTPALQSALDKTLQLGENVLMARAGAHGEGIAVTDRRVIILREQMPIVGTETQVDCFDYAYEAIRSVGLDAATGGGHLHIVPLVPPLEPDHATIYFPSYDEAKFEVTVSRIRLLVEQTRGVPAGSATESATPRCPSCAGAVEPRDLYCQACGARLGEACGACLARLPEGSRFCPHCGSPTDRPRAATCVACQSRIAPDYRYCPRCGAAQARPCPSCGEALEPQWLTCPRCGADLPPDRDDGTAWSFTYSVDEPGSETLTQPERGEAYNGRGMRLYEQERYEEALQAFDRAVQLEPTHPLYHCNRGVVLAELRRDADALRAYETAIALAPGDPTAYLNLGYYHAARSASEEAARAWRRVIDVAPDSPEAAEARENLSALEADAP